MNCKMAEELFFKKCSMCRKTWANKDIFLEDASLVLEGYAADFEKLENGLFYFTHRVQGCYTTMALAARDFLSLYTGEKYPASKMGGDECPRLCLDRSKLDRCSAFCENAFIREIIQIIRERQGHGIGPGSKQIARDAQGTNE
jgi:hypothetical protein